MYSARNLYAIGTLRARDVLRPFSVATQHKAQRNVPWQQATVTYRSCQRRAGATSGRAATRRRADWERGMLTRASLLGFEDPAEEGCTHDAREGLDIVDRVSVGM